ncbi:LicD family protein [Ruminococcus albus]|uniref:Lipopolysaccharide cholinephosphotransferase n=1 Tax=Ruminococcus albus TaxID=1264 RepID=A0A1H7KQW8_RUMAL|nr:LicD family protein [Ruminococcus albus]SEK88910.1 lipopolysaccharide cholinephosphotransferase [Ruminococcus albus]
MDKLKQLQQVELGILRDVIEICNRHKLRYYMLGGTLLGAVRHKGFIPWDDDIDIGMPRPDYDKFIRIAAEELKSPYDIYTTNNGKGEYSYYYARVVNKKTRLLRKMSQKEVKIPVWIDVFPLDGVPNDNKVVDKWLKKCRFRFRIFNYSQYSYFVNLSRKHDNDNFFTKTFRYLFYYLRIENLISTKWAWRRLDNLLKAYDYDECDSLINFCGAWGVREMFSKSIYGKGKLYKFEDMELIGPENYDFVLSQMYGDYMTPPKDADKNRHNIEVECL